MSNGITGLGMARPEEDSDLSVYDDLYSAETLESKRQLQLRKRVGAQQCRVSGHADPVPAGDRDLLICSRCGELSRGDRG